MFAALSVRLAMTSVKHQRVLLIVMLFLGPAFTATAVTWKKEGASKEQRKLDMRECSAFIERMVKPVPKEGKLGNQKADLKGNKYNNANNRRAIRRWCMERRGYSSGK